CLPGPGSQPVGPEGPDRGADVPDAEHAARRRDRGAAGHDPAQCRLEHSPERGFLPQHGAERDTHHGLVGDLTPGQARDPLVPQNRARPLRAGDPPTPPGPGRARTREPSPRPGTSPPRPRPIPVAVRPLAAAADTAAPVAQTLSTVYRRPCHGRMPATLLYAARTAHAAIANPASARREPAPAAPCPCP